MRTAFFTVLVAIILSYALLSEVKAGPTDAIKNIVDVGKKGKWTIRTDKNYGFVSGLNLVNLIGNGVVYCYPVEEHFECDEGIYLGWVE